MIKIMVSSWGVLLSTVWFCIEASIAIIRGKELNWYSLYTALGTYVIFFVVVLFNVRRK